LRAFIWHARRGSFRTSVIYPGRGEVPIFGTEWPGYGFDEWFTSVALYPRLAEAGMITDVAAARDGGFFLPLDIEYATWANPDNCLACPVLPGPEGRAPDEGAVSDPMEAYRYWRETDRTSFSIGEDDYAFLVDCVRENQVKRVIEIGPGDSTWAFLENDCEVFSFEYDMAYLQRARERFAAYPSVNVMQYHDRVGLGLRSEEHTSEL